MADAALDHKAIAERLWKIELVARSEYDTDEKAFEAVKSMIFKLRREVESNG